MSFFDNVTMHERDRSSGESDGRDEISKPLDYDDKMKLVVDRIRNDFGI